MAAATRLERLVSLLDTGSTPAIKSTAARQLGQIASQRVRGGATSHQPLPKESGPSIKAEGSPPPSLGQEADASHKPQQQQHAIDVYHGTRGEWDEALHLCSRIVPFLHSRSWDTREAAALAIESICRGAGVWDPISETAAASSSSAIKQELIQDAEASADALAPMSQDDLLSFGNFDLPLVLKNGVKLLSSTGKEYDIFSAGGTVADRLAQAKADMAKMGLGGMGGIDMDIGLDMEEELKQGEANYAAGKTASTVSSPGLPPASLISKLPPPRFTPGGSSAASPASTATSSATAPTTVKREATTPTTPAAPPSPAEEVDLSKLSARERNQLKRKRKLEGKNLGNISSATMDSGKTRVLDGAGSAGASATTPSAAETFSSATGLRIKTPSRSGAVTPTDYIEAGQKAHANGNSTNGSSPIASPGVGSKTLAAASSTVTSNTVSLVAPPGEWPFAHLTSLLLLDLFSPRWETRHGACLGLRSIFSNQGVGAGMSLLAASDAENRARKAKWAEDCAVKIICLLSLDRLSDFVFDHVVAPVREVGAQALSALLPHMSKESVQQTQRVLLAMIRQSFVVSEDEKRLGRRGDAGYAWEVRHAGLSGLRWVIEARNRSAIQGGDVETASLAEVVDVAVLCLGDSDDDIRAAASSVLLPMADNVLVRDLSDRLPNLLKTLWNCLSDLKDDLNSSTGSVMDLLALLLRHQAVIDLLRTSGKPLASLVPLTYPFFRHTITSVRLSVLNTLQVFLAGDLTQDGWLDDRVFRLLFQNLIVEEKPHIREATTRAWHAALGCANSSSTLTDFLVPHIDSMLRILMTPLGTPFDFTLFYTAVATTSTDGSRYNVDKSILNQDLALIGVDTVIRGRLGAAHALGVAFASLSTDNAAYLLLQYLDSHSALQKCLAATVVQEWAEAGEMVSSTASLTDRLLDLINAPPPPTWSEMTLRLTRMQTDCVALLRAFQNEGKVPKAKLPTLPTYVDSLGHDHSAFTVESAQRVVTSDYDLLSTAIGPKLRQMVLPLLSDRRHKIIAAVAFYRDAKDKQDTQVYAAISAALIALKTLPSKLNPIIRSIMNSVKFEENVDLQQRSARGVASFVAFCRSPLAKADPSPKIVKNLCAFVCQDATRTAIFEATKKTREGILSLNEPLSARSRGKAAAAPNVDLDESEEVRQGKLIRRGAEMTLQEMADRFGKDLFDLAPALWEGMTATLIEVFSGQDGDALLGASAEKGQGVLDGCTLIEAVSIHLTQDHQGRLDSLLPVLSAALCSSFAVVRSAAAKCLSSLADSMTQSTMIHIVRDVLPVLGDVKSLTNRQGAIELLSHVVNRLDLKLLPYVIVLIVPILGRMSDSDDAVRLMATNTFASLIKMVPLEAGLPDPVGFPADLLQRRDEERKFLSQLLDGNKVEPYEMPVEVNADLRKYQREGVSWMNFLAKFQLHGILCDDMGLGKTLQSICILASKHFERDERWKDSRSPDSAPLPSLVVCPPTLTGHWYHEIQKYATNLSPLLYSGVPAERQALQSQFAKHDVVVMSYDVVRNDIAYLSTLNWHYCILDEGHIIKGGKTKTTQAVKMIKAVHRLILTGTPVQNNVLELWSLFDFLMPGFLGTERSFHERFGKPILATREGKASAKESEAASLALESLHKQVLPFLLRRLKDDVLDDLPPKIIQDVECDLGAVQKELYDDYNRGGKDVEELLEGEDEAPLEEKQHVFQTLQYLRKLVNHPSLVFDASNPKHRAIEDRLVKSGGSLKDIRHAPKLEALRELLQTCGIGLPSANNGSAGSSALDDGPISSQHRVLIFCQMKQMMNIIEHELFKVHMPSVTYMRLDGSVPSEKRHGIVTQFNSDPSIDVLLLTTQVGGLGLTLTGADTVIFVEHDWNPMKDLQAMDRAHRLGQKRVVNVYRLITRDTLEARIMGLQQFKLNVANAIVTQQNKGLDSMATEQVLDLFTPGAASGAGVGTKGQAAGAAEGGQSLLEAALAAGGKKGKGFSQKALLAGLEASGDTGDDYAAMGQWKG
ncbi:hypothetical protein BCV69DRAFT_270773 [Microstroma glucosiphilum]|uniref:Uncharacterized protein n=1 Tax=Pseudomicrostroma glucosiphilum TaxID=1684307 RepID=A0A316U527_9BASI|nr:hypothetical protein BCV69DRAFT_270773 [Pseudomicrostroma glucosiphilum]PWN20339.1 hypothetical protein BCV69DRAFT_270773 [Pseudomicrostroma glucosiphilum]